MSVKSRNGKWFGVAMRVLVVTGLCGCAGCDQEQYGVTPLWRASLNGDTETVKLLLDANADVNAARKTDGVTPLYVASQNGHTETVKLLLDAKADVNAAHKTDG
ncbi:MAG: ankyrin repeat domain-containing protein, partial [Gemmatimonadales bacterium]